MNRKWVNVVLLSVTNL